MSWIQTAFNAISAQLKTKLSKSEALKLFQKKEDAFDRKWDSIKDKPKFSKVATSGAFSDLNNIPGNYLTMDYSDKNIITDQFGNVPEFISDCQTDNGVGWAVGYEFNAYGEIDKINLYMIDLSSEDGLNCLLVEALNIPVLRDAHIHVLEYKSDTYIVLSDDSGDSLFYAKIPEDFEIQSGSYRINFHEGTWVLGKGPSSIAYSKIDGVDTFVAVNRWSDGSYSELSFISNDLVSWRATDLLSFPSGRYYWGYDQVVACEAFGDGIKFVAISSMLDQAHGIAYSYDGIEWSYKQYYANSSMRIKCIYNRLLVVDYSYIYETYDLITWKLLSTFTGVYGTVEGVFYNQKLYDGDYHDYYLITTNRGATLLVDNQEKITVDVTEYDCRNMYCSLFDGMNDMTILTKYDGNITALNVISGLLDSSIYHDDVSEKVAKYITPHLPMSAVAFSGKYKDLLEIPNFSTVATSGSYDDLQDALELNINLRSHSFPEPLFSLSSLAVNRDSGCIVLVGSSNGSPTDKSYYSYDGIEWNAKEMPLKSNWVDVAFAASYSGNRFVAMGKDGQIAIITNIENPNSEWVTGSICEDEINWMKIVGNYHGNFVVVGYNGDNFAYSADGASWTLSTLPESTSWADLKCLNRKYFLLPENDDFILKSEDGVTWSKIVLPHISKEKSCMTYGKIYCNPLVDSYIIFYSNSSKILYSRDLVNWTILDIGETVDFQNVESSNGYFVALNDRHKRIYISKDCRNWERISSGDDWLRDVAVLDYGSFIVCTDSSVLLSFETLKKGDQDYIEKVQKSIGRYFPDNKAVEKLIDDKLSDLGTLEGGDY